MTDEAYPSYCVDNVVRIVIPEEYFFPCFNLAVEALTQSPDYQAAHTILLDFTKCHSVHGIGMSLETQLFYEQAKAHAKSVCWVGNPSMYSIVVMLNAATSGETLPYRDF